MMMTGTPWALEMLAKAGKELDVQKTPAVQAQGHEEELDVEKTPAAPVRDHVRGKDPIVEPRAPLREQRRVESHGLRSRRKDLDAPEAPNLKVDAAEAPLTNRVSMLRHETTTNFQIPGTTLALGDLGGKEVLWGAGHQVLEQLLQDLQR